MADTDSEFARSAALLEAEMKNDIQLAMFKSVLDIAAIALNAALLVNGGATVAMLAFIGSAKSNSVTFDLHKLIGALIFFALAVLAALIASGVAYVTQAEYARTKGAEISLENKAVATLIFVSYFFFLVGIILAACGMKP